MQFIGISLSIIVIASSMVMTIYSIPNDVKIKKDLTASNTINLFKQQIVTNSDSDQNSTLLSIDNKKIKGILLVKIIVNNKDVGNKSSPDFKINIHANDPFPSSFPGNSSGTNVKLGMGMYSITESFIPGYSTSYSTDCFGGIMSTGEKECIIINTFDNSALIPK